MIYTYKMKIFGTICLIILLTACSNSKEINSSDNSNDNSNSKVLTNVSKSIDDGDSVNDKVTISLQMGLKDETLIVKEENKNIDENLNINVKEDNQVLLSKDPVYDIVYYVNYGLDFFIYRIKDGKSELVVEMPAKRLFCINGKLYFMLKSYDAYTLKDMKDGNIFCYDPVSGNVEKIIDASAQKMFVYEDGIYYVVAMGETEHGENMFSTKEYMYNYSFLTKKSEKIDVKYISLLKWKDYHITYELKEKDEEEVYQLYGVRGKFYEVASINLETLDKSKSIKLIDNRHLQNYSIAGDKLYYVFDYKSFNICGIETQKTKEIPLAVQCNKDFTVLNNGMIYIDSLLQINPETGTQSLITPENEYETIYELYTDGENLYGVVNPYEYGVLKRIIIEEHPEDATSLTNEDGISYEINRFIYRTLPMGEE